MRRVRSFNNKQKERRRTEINGKGTNSTTARCVAMFEIQDKILMS
jgi:hypothetical protein